MTLIGKNLKCPWCKWEGGWKDLENHLHSQHFLSYRVGCEISTLQRPGEDGVCYKCGSAKTPLTFLIPSYYYVPCWGCLNARERKAMIKSLLEEIDEFYDRILNDRYLQLFLIDPVYYEATIPHTYDTFKAVLGKKDLPSRNNIWFLDWMRGIPKIISGENLDGILVKDLGELYKITSTPTEIRVNKWVITTPQIVNYDSIHHGRYNILNLTGDRRTKRLRIPGTDTCYKFWNNDGEFPQWKSILRVFKGENRENNVLHQMKPLDLLTLKLVLLRNKNFMRHVFGIIRNILSQGVGVFRDSVFLGNTIDIYSKDEKRKYILNLAWSPKELDQINEPNTINISIL